MPGIKKNLRTKTKNPFKNNKKILLNLYLEDACFNKVSKVLHDKNNNRFNNKLLQKL